MSRVEIASIQLGIDYEALAAEQARDPETATYKTVVTNLRWEYANIGTTKILCDISTGRPRPLVPKNFRKQIFNTIHSLAHPSIRTTTKLMTEKFIWHSIKRDTRTWTKCCEDCQRSKVHRHTKSPIGSTPQPTRRFGHIHVDVVGPLPVSDEKRYIFTVIDRSTRWPEATPMEDATAASCASALLNSWISRFGVPEHITSDRGSTFTAELLKEQSTLMGAGLHHTTAYHPEANGIVERSHRTLKAALTARCTGHQWTSHLPWVLLGLRTAPKEGLDVSAAEMVYGEQLTVPGEFFPRDQSTDDVNVQKLRETVGRFAPCRPIRVQQRHTYVPRDLRTTKYVFIREDAHRAPLTPPYKGPFLVLDRHEKTFKLQLSNRTDWVAIDRLKPAYLEATDHDDKIYTRSGRLSKPRTLLDI